MISNTQKRSGVGNSLNKTNLTVFKPALAGQDLYANEAGDVAPSTWFTGSPTFLDNTDNSLYYTNEYRVICSDVSSFDDTNTYVAYVTHDRLNSVTALHLKKVNPVTGELLATVSLVPTLQGTTGSNLSDKIAIQVVPISATQVSVVLHTYIQGNTTYNCSAAKFTLSGTTFTNGGWSTTVTTSGVTGSTTAVYFSGVTGTANRWAYFVRQVTNTSAVVYLYKHSTNTITAITLSYASSTHMGQAHWLLCEGTDNLMSVITADMTAAYVRGIIGSSASQVTSNTLNIASSMQACTGAFSTAAGQLQLFGVATQVGAKYPHKFLSVTIDAGLTAIASGAVVTIPQTAKIGNFVSLQPVLWANGQYILTAFSSKRAMLQPPSGINNSSYDYGAGFLVMIKGTATVPSAAPADLTTAYVSPAAKIEEANWQPAATKRLRIIYTTYYKNHNAPTGFGTYADNASVQADLPWLFMPEFTYAAGKNGLAYVGTAVNNIAAGATGPVVLSTQAVKLNGNISPVKTIRNGVLALTNAWGVKLPPGQRNDGTFDLTSVTVVLEGVTTPSGVGGAMINTSVEGSALYLENQKGSAVTYTKAYLEGNPAVGDSVFNLLAYVDGRMMTAAQSRYVTAGTNVSLRAEFNFNDHLFFTFGNGHDWSGQDTAVRKVMTRISSLKPEAKYYE